MNRKELQAEIARRHKHRTFSRRMVHFGLPYWEMVERLEKKGQSRPRAMYEALRAKLIGKRPYGKWPR